MRLGPDVLLLSAKQHPFLSQLLYCWQVGGFFFTVPVVIDMGQLLVQAQNCSEELILVLVCIIQTNCTICSGVMFLESATVSCMMERKAIFIIRFSVTERNAYRD